MSEIQKMRNSLRDELVKLPYIPKGTSKIDGTIGDKLTRLCDHIWRSASTISRRIGHLKDGRWTKDAHFNVRDFPVLLDFSNRQIAALKALQQHSRKTTETIPQVGEVVAPWPELRAYEEFKE